MSPRLLSALVVSGLLSCAYAHDSTAADPVTATIDLTTDQGKPCTVTTTDPLGLHLEQNGTHLTANPATLTGEGCGTGAGGSTNPPTTPFVLTPDSSPLVATVGQPFKVSWILAGGVTPITCTGSASGAPATATLAAWKQSVVATIGANSRTVTPVAADVGNGTVAVTFTLAMKCSNADGSITSANLPITINPEPPPVDDSCPAGQLVGTKLCYKTASTACTPNTTAEATNMTIFDSWIGRRAASSTVIEPAQPPYLTFATQPGGSGPVFAIGDTQYVGAKFTVPAASGTWTVGKKGQLAKALPTDVNNGSNADMSISTTCGDFDNVPAACKRMNIANSGPGVAWVFGQDSTGRCRLDPNVTYYLNVRTNGCTTGTCRLRIDGSIPSN